MLFAASLSQIRHPVLYFYRRCPAQHVGDVFSLRSCDFVLLIVREVLPYGWRRFSNLCAFQSYPFDLLLSILPVLIFVRIAWPPTCHLSASRPNTGDLMCRARSMSHSRLASRSDCVVSMCRSSSASISGVDGTHMSSSPSSSSNTQSRVSPLWVTRII